MNLSPRAAEILEDVKRAMQPAEEMGGPGRLRSADAGDPRGSVVALPQLPRRWGCVVTRRFDPLRALAETRRDMLGLKRNAPAGSLRAFLAQQMRGFYRQDKRRAMQRVELPR